MAAGCSTWGPTASPGIVGVLLLPYLGHRDLFDQYDFSQPWDMRKNLRLLDKIPAVYHDPIYGDQPGQFTHYAAVAGSSWLIPTAFPVSGMEMKDVTILPLKCLSEQDVSRDGNGELRVKNLPILKFEPSNSRQMYLEQVVFDNFAIVVAGVAPDRKIPWTKPEDITVGPGFPFKLGVPGGIAAPYSFGTRPNVHRGTRALRKRHEPCSPRHHRSGDAFRSPVRLERRNNPTQ